MFVVGMRLLTGLRAAPVTETSGGSSTCLLLGCAAVQPDKDMIEGVPRKGRTPIRKAKVTSPENCQH